MKFKIIASIIVIIGILIAIAVSSDFQQENSDSGNTNNDGIHFN